MKLKQIINVSVIIPVYNSEKYLKKCLDSVVKQSLKEIEIICIDDGSTDNSNNILKEYKRNDKRFVLLHQKHKHAGCARNYGLSIAKGKYVIFWDSDDYFKLNALEKMFIQIEKDNADICVCGARGYFEDDDFEAPWASYLRTKLITGDRPFNIITEPNNILTFTNPVVWNKMFKTSFLKEQGVEFPDIRNIEDIYFTNCNLCIAKAITYVDEDLVIYRRNTQNSAVSHISEQGIEIVDLWIETANFLKENSIFPERSFSNACLQGLVYAFGNINKWKEFKKTFLYLQNKLTELHIYNDCNGYYDNKDYSLIVGKLYFNTPEEFVVWLKTYYCFTNTKNSAKRRYNNEKNKNIIEKLKKENELFIEQSQEITTELESNKKKVKKLKKKNIKLNEDLEKNKQQYEEKINKLNKKLNKTTNRLNEIENSRYYKLLKSLHLVK